MDYLFDGLDKSYMYHKYLSISALILVFSHNITISIGKDMERAAGIREAKDSYAMFESLCMYS